MTYGKETEHNSAGEFAAQEFYTTVRELLAVNNVTQVELARRLDMTYDSFRTWLRPGRKVNMYSAARIADALGYDFEFRLVPKELREAHRPPIRADCSVCRMTDLKLTKKGRLPNHGPGRNRDMPSCRGSGMQIWEEPEKTA